MKIENISTREDLADYIKCLELESVAVDCDWENIQLDRYLEAMSGWVSDMDGFYKNAGLNMQDEPMWRIFARMLTAAAYYE